MKGVKCSNNSWLISRQLFCILFIRSVVIRFFLQNCNMRLLSLSSYLYKIFSILHHLASKCHFQREEIISLNGQFNKLYVLTFHLNIFKHSCFIFGLKYTFNYNGYVPYWRMNIIEISIFHIGIPYAYCINVIIYL